MSKFYSEIAKYYHHIFPLQELRLKWMKALAGDVPKSVLDIACGDGLYVLALAECGYDVTAIDLDEEMIAKIKTKNSAIDARVMNMLDISSLEERYDLIFCIGNSLVHLASLEEMAKVLDDCKALLNENGRLLIQIVNYDRILDQGLKGLPTIENPEVGLVFERHYEPCDHPQKLAFKTKLTVGDEVYENKECLFALRTLDLLNLLKEAGFSEPVFYGGFEGQTFEIQNSMPLVAVV